MKVIGLRSLCCIVIIQLLRCSSTPDGTTPPQPQPSIYDWTIQAMFFQVDLNDIFFTNALNGWAVGKEQSVFSTVNGGQTWPLTPISSLVTDLQSVFLLDSQNGWMAGGTKDESAGYLFLSSNGGAYPEPKKMLNSPLKTVFFLDDVNGWAAGGDGLITSTTDGINWESSSIGDPVAIHDIQFLSPILGWAATANGGLYHTEDGLAWARENLSIASTIRAIFFSDSQHGWACGDSNVILRGKPGAGNNLEWIMTSIPGEPANMIWTDIRFVDQVTGWVVGYGGNVYKTTDGGQTWLPETTGVTANLNAIYMVNQAQGWIVGNGGTILKYTPN
jgi:photosystem II stability/assembly factor-like uncharacterized protein